MAEKPSPAVHRSRVTLIGLLIAPTLLGVALGADAPYIRTDRAEYPIPTHAPLEPVIISFFNPTDDAVALPSTAPYEIRRASGELVYHAGGGQWVVSVAPGASVQLEWDYRTSCVGHVSPERPECVIHATPGDYIVAWEYLHGEAKITTASFRIVVPTPL